MFDGLWILVVAGVAVGAILGIGAIVTGAAYLLERSLKKARRKAGLN